ncbi:MAG: septum formation initiator family protein [Bacillota bacterium]|jgi:cell division protein DivIC|nr:septum formation initiator family protein [Bacillota bacterium]NLL26471.1 septum formation initiator family protein [Erysipelotrichia bacterium]
MKKEKVRKLTPLGKFVRILIGMVMIAAIVYMYLQMGKEIKTTFSLHGDVKESEKEIAKLEAEKESLQMQKEKLTDENYVSSVARGKYLITKENEQIYVLPPLTEEND